MVASNTLTGGSTTSGSVGYQVMAEWGVIPVSYKILSGTNLAANVNFFSTDVNPAWFNPRRFQIGTSGSEMTQPGGMNGTYLRGGRLDPFTGLPPGSLVTQLQFTFPTGGNVLLSAPGSNTYAMCIAFFRAAPLYINSFACQFDVVGQCAQPQDLTGTQIGQTFLVSWNGPSLVDISASTDGGASFFPLETNWVGNDYLLDSGLFAGAIPPIIRVVGVCQYGIQFVTSVDVDITLQLAPAGGNRPRHRFTRH